MSPEERYHWLCHWLLPCEGEVIRMADDHEYQRVAYFQLAFFLFNVYLDHTTHDYLWYVSSDYTLTHAQLIASARFPTRRDLLRAVADAWPYPPTNTPRPLRPL